MGIFEWLGTIERKMDFNRNRTSKLRLTEFYKMVNSHFRQGADTQRLLSANTNICRATSKGVSDHRSAQSVARYGDRDLFLKKVRVRAGPDENYLIVSPELVDKKEISPDMAFPIIRPLTSQRVIVVFRRQTAFVCDEQQHRFFESSEVEAP
jgi:hypothetical protein